MSWSLALMSPHRAYDQHRAAFSAVAVLITSPICLYALPWGRMRSFQAVRLRAAGLCEACEPLVSLAVMARLQ